MNKLQVLIFIAAYPYFVFCDRILIDLSSYHPSQHDYSIFYKTYDLTDNLTIVEIKDIQNDVGFLLMQLHTYAENVTLSSSFNLTQGSFTTGTNTGLVLDSFDSSAIFYLIRNAKIDNTLHILLAVNIYDSQDPVPGGCNLSFDTEIAPYQLIEYNNNIITVKNQPPSAKGVTCDNNTVQLDMYHLFLYEYDNSIDTYFNGIKKMLTVESIMKYGKRIPNIEGRRKFMRLYSSYIGTGEIFAVISTYRNQRSAYVPAASYGCDVLNWRGKCIGPVAVHWKFLCACQLFFGIFICFYGHRFFRFTLYIVSFTFGLIVTYIIISIEEHLAVTETVITAFTVGFIYGIIWLLVWRKFGMPCLTVHLAFILSGFLTASLFFYTVLADISVFSNDINYWIVFLCILITCLVISLPNAMLGHIASITFLGSYACVMALSYYVGGNLPYILINTYRRVAVKDFNMAVIDPPVQIIDILHILLWVLLFLFGMFVQLRHQRGRPPFPPNRRFDERNVMVSETSPLLHPDIFAPPPYESIDRSYISR